MHLHGCRFRVVSDQGGSRRTPPTARGRTRSRCCRGETVVVQPYFDGFGGRLRLPLPQLRARRPGDDGDDGGGRMRLRAAPAAGSRCPGPPGRRHAPRRRPRHAAAFRSVSSPIRCPPSPGTRCSGAWPRRATRRPTTQYILADSARRHRDPPRSAPTRPRPPAPSSAPAGAYQFYCSIHGGLNPGGMHGVVNVTTTDPGPPVDPGQRWVTGEETARPQRADQRHDRPDGVRGGRQHPAHARSCSRRNRPIRARRRRSRSPSTSSSRCGSSTARRSSPPRAPRSRPGKEDDHRQSPEAPAGQAEARYRLQVWATDGVDLDSPIRGGVDRLPAVIARAYGGGSARASARRGGSTCVHRAGRCVPRRDPVRGASTTRTRTTDDWLRPAVAADRDASSAALYYVAARCADGRVHNGQTPRQAGRRASASCRDDGQPVGVKTVLLGQLLLKFIAGGLLVIGWFIDGLWPLGERENRALHDFPARTHVVSTARQSCGGRRPPPPPAPGAAATALTGHRGPDLTAAHNAAEPDSARRSTRPSSRVFPGEPARWTRCSAYSSTPPTARRCSARHSTRSPSRPSNPA